MSIKNHHHLNLKKAFTFSKLSMVSKTSAFLLMLLFSTSSEKTASSELVSSESFVAEIYFKNHLYAETGVPPGSNFREQVKIYSKYRFEDTEMLQKVKDKIMNHLDFSFHSQTSRSCSETI